MTSAIDGLPILLDLARTRHDPSALMIAVNWLVALRRPDRELSDACLVASDILLWGGLSREDAWRATLARLRTKLHFAESSGDDAQLEEVLNAFADMEPLPSNLEPEERSAYYYSNGRCLRLAATRFGDNDLSIKAEQNFRRSLIEAPLHLQTASHTLTLYALAVNERNIQAPSAERYDQILELMNRSVLATPNDRVSIVRIKNLHMALIERIMASGFDWSILAPMASIEAALTKAGQQEQIPGAFWELALAQTRLYQSREPEQYVGAIIILDRILQHLRPGTLDIEFFSRTTDSQMPAVTPWQTLHSIVGFLPNKPTVLTDFESGIVIWREDLLNDLMQRVSVSSQSGAQTDPSTRTDHSGTISEAIARYDQHMRFLYAQCFFVYMTWR